MPLVLASNEVNVSDKYRWKDITGVQYHFPNSYRKLVKPGERFLYYRGVRRADGTRKAAEYFGQGTVGTVWRDEAISESTPKAKWAWYCSIDDYRSFPAPVPAKVDGEYWETIPRNGWRNGVRRIDESTINRVLATAGASVSQPIVGAENLPQVEDEDLLRPSADLLLSSAIRNGGGGNSRYSRNSILIGNRAESIALRWAELRFPNAKRVRWVSQDGETPGWDIEVIDAEGQFIGIEVKGTTGGSFSSFELTKGELEASRSMGDRYVLVLVANCLTDKPKLQILTNPWDVIEKQGLTLEPLVYRVRSSV
jgi:hypothetical protein